jgi:uncharacterized protein YbbC (DUF1343 family)
VPVKLGIDRLCEDSKLKKELSALGRVGLVGHPASTNSKLVHSLDLLTADKSLTLSCAFGPQHGMRGEKQDNMIESDDYVDPVTGTLVFSLYGKVRRPTDEMMSHCDVVLFDLQDVGCRIYTYVTTLFYMMEACARLKKPIWVLDRPNPIGRPVEGSYLEKNFESFVGFGPIPMRHGLTCGELAKWIKEAYALDVDLRVVEMQGYHPREAPGFGWPTGKLAWVNPSPNMPTLCTARAFCGTVMLEGTMLSEGRGTTRPLQMFGAPGIKTRDVQAEMLALAPSWLEGCIIRECFFEPTFHKFKGELCSGFQIHVDDDTYNEAAFRPYRLMLLFFKALRNLQPDIMKWRQPPYEYEHERLPIDLLTGSQLARLWVDDKNATPQDLDKRLAHDEVSWIEQRRPFLIYGE